MANRGVAEKPSESALMAALRRAIANIEYKNGRFGPDDLAVHFLPPHYRFFLKFEKIQKSTREKLDKFFPGVTEYLIARTAHFDAIFTDALKRNISQIVLLGAGYDSRAYRFAAWIKNTRIFELDIAPTQQRKKKCLQKTKIAIPSRVIFVPIDFNRESLANVLEKAGFRKDQQTLFIWEGVSYYLDPQSVDAVLNFFSHAVHKDSIIAFDYAVAVPLERMNDYYAAKEFFQSMKHEQASEEILFSIEEDKIKPFLEQRDLKLVEHLNNTEIEKRFLTREDGSLIGHIPAHLRFVTAAPKADDNKLAAKGFK